MSKRSTYIIYRLSDGQDTYVGMTTQTLSTRLRQHKKDAKLDGESCAITAKLCKKKLPKDVKALHRRLRDHGAKFRIAALKTMENATYRQAHAEEKKMKAKHSNLAAW